MLKLRNKLNKKGGFTLIEMLIVVAIIAILIAVSIPLVGTALDRAKAATDAANIRAAKAEVTIMYLTDQTLGDDAMQYDAAKGKVVTKDPADVKPYGKVTGNTENIVWVKWDKTKAEFSYAWAKPGSANAPSSDWKTDIPVSAD